jgi:asparagine synthase (glutamine-hydrolysing)
MCGISGVYTGQYDGLSNAKVAALAQKAKRVQKNRGPDHFGTFVNRDRTIALFHNRLSLVDLSRLGNQPMRKHGLCVTFNGEIYNFRELKAELITLGYTFTSESDTEVILSAFDAWGEKALLKFNGPYALALYDSKRETLLLARDKVGEKPLFYCRGNGKSIYFASSVQLLQSFCDKEFKINEERVLSDLIFNFWSDKSVTHFLGINTVEPGFFVRIDSKLRMSVKHYWDIPKNEIIESSKKAVQKIEELLIDATAVRANLDTKICSVLSGGIDSSLISILAQNTLTYRLATFSLAKKGHINEDLKAARFISAQNHWRNHAVKIRRSDLTDEKLVDITAYMEEPALDQVYVYINRNYDEIHKQGFKAVLNGQGADEIFFGYLNYYPFLRTPNNFSNTGRFQKFWFDNFILKQFVEKERIVDVIQKNLSRNYEPYCSADKVNSVLRFGVKTHMPALLIQEDKQSMAWSVECRTVYTDYRLVQYLSQLPSKMKHTQGREKSLLKEVAKKYLPPTILERKKLGFPELPDGREALVAKIINAKIVERSTILNKILSPKLFNNIDQLPLGIKWKLCAIALFEKKMEALS